MFILLLSLFFRSFSEIKNPNLFMPFSSHPSLSSSLPFNHSLFFSLPTIFCHLPFLLLYSTHNFGFVLLVALCVVWLINGTKHLCPFWPFPANTLATNPKRIIIINYQCFSVYLCSFSIWNPILLPLITYIYI